ncbi:hypothetical protein AKJ57_05285 [candidate division MSBL1 archaeon SCGC-AAA259A05]|uniref:Polymerase/histidinol phosphatase N-terminal domain-containing protein n=1 Tax=candidate division MSBL1 archaeon SCGC-AAA259A05 TaxID=1698259 RepID=A0A133U5J3_9EURY|nr:hypothetical protein AKJ57_05285 [candidate division MSBL1 archaeon SCGC-AAA259A05]
MFQRHDFHVHTYYSDGVSSPVKVVESAAEKKLKAVAITDHGPDLAVGIEPGKVGQMIEDINILKADAEIFVLSGLEANILNPEGDIDIRDKVQEKLDIVLAGIHYISSSEISPKRMARNYFESVMNAMKNHEIDILAHPFWYREDLSSYLDREDLEKFAETSVERDVAIELNEKYRVPNRKFLSICEEKDAKFSLGTDAHALDQIGEFGWSTNMLKEAGIDRKDLIVEKFCKEK